MSYKILVLHGPNLNLLGEREPEIYGTLSLAELNQKLKKSAKEMGVTLRAYQSNSEGELIDLLHQNRKWAQGVVFNPAAYTHYSYALRDAVSAIKIPVIEVHLSDIKKREPFRRKSVIAPACLDQVSGLGWKSYLEGIKRLKKAAQSLALAFWLVCLAHLFVGRDAQALELEFLGGWTKPGATIDSTSVEARSAPLQVNFGVLLDAYLSQEFFMQYGILYGPRGFALSSGNVTSTYTGTAIQMPILLRKTWFKFFSIGVGGYGAYSLGQGTWTNPPSGVQPVSSMDFGLLVSTDIRIRVSSFFSLVADVRYLYGFQALAESNSFTASASDFQLFAGLRFGK